MGYALAQAALNRGAEVTLISGPATVIAPVGKLLKLTRVVSTEEMREATLAAAGEADLILCAAAVADYRPSKKSLTKIKKYSLSSSVLEAGEEARISIDFTLNPDILAELGEMKATGKLKESAILVGFAAETDKLDEHVRAKLETKGADFIVANDVSRADIGFESNENEVRILSRVGMDALLPKTGKLQLARQILELVMSQRA
jgi:phosphopantothenoylcysteine decarboxylase/phosphopantothenate--cysteine ligase